MVDFIDFSNRQQDQMFFPVIGVPALRLKYPIHNTCGVFVISDISYIIFD
jgi:hypothetical protein